MLYRKENNKLYKINAKIKNKIEFIKTNKTLELLDIKKEDLPKSEYKKTFYEIKEDIIIVDEERSLEYSKERIKKNIKKTKKKEQNKPVVFNNKMFNSDLESLSHYKNTYDYIVRIEGSNEVPLFTKDNEVIMLTKEECLNLIDIINRKLYDTKKLEVDLNIKIDEASTLEELNSIKWENL